MPTALLKPNERYAFVGKTRSGKTALAMVLAGTFARTLAEPWQVWWFDTKNDPKDLAALRKWGFRNAASSKDRQPEAGGLTNAIYYLIKENKDGPSTVEQVQALCESAYNRGHVILVIDEYVQAVPSAKNAGQALLNVFQRGGGKNVGIIGLTQEPVYVPRQLISQATHICLLSLTYQHDIKYVRNICPIYVPPIKNGQPYGFYWSWVDGSGEWDYYVNQAAWFSQLQAAKNIGIPEGVPTK
jgi:hypothetical protein